MAILASSSLAPDETQVHHGRSEWTGLMGEQRVTIQGQSQKSFGSLVPTWPSCLVPHFNCTAIVLEDLTEELGPMDATN